MPTLDRRIAVTLAAPGAFVEGTYVEGPAVTKALWATEQGGGSSDTEDTTGTRVEVRKEFLIRHDVQIARARPDQVTIVDSLGITYNCETVEQVDETRRRFLTLTGLADATRPAMVDFVPADFSEGLA